MTKTLMKLRSYSIDFLILSSCAACAGMPRGIKLYESNPERGGIERSQAKEFVPYAQTSAFYCMSKEHVEKLLMSLKGNEIQKRKRLLDLLQ